MADEVRKINFVNGDQKFAVDWNKLKDKLTTDNEKITKNESLNTIFEKLDTNSDKKITKDDINNFTAACEYAGYKLDFTDEDGVTVDDVKSLLINVGLKVSDENISKFYNSVKDLSEDADAVIPEPVKDTPVAETDAAVLDAAIEYYKEKQAETKTEEKQVETKTEEKQAETKTEEKQAETKTEEKQAETKTEDMGNDDVDPTTFDFTKGKLTNVTIDASAAGIASKSYNGEVRLPKGTEAPTDGSMPKTLLMTLPKAYNGGVTRLTYDEESKMYVSRNKDMKFELKKDADGNVTLTAVKNDELSKLRNDNLQKWKNEEQVKAKQAKIEAKKGEARTIASNIKEQFNSKFWPSADTEAKLKTINEDNVAYVVQACKEEYDLPLAKTVSFNSELNKKDVIKYIVDPLLEKAEKLGATKYGKKTISEVRGTMYTMSLDDIQKLMDAFAKYIVEKEAK